MVYPPHLVLHKAISDVEYTYISDMNFLESLGYLEYGEEVFLSIKRNSFRIHAQWWDGFECLSIDTWLKYVQKIQASNTIS